MSEQKSIKSFKDLRVWQKAFDLSLQVYRMTADFPRAEMHGLVSQMRRASVSIPANIAEGHARHHRQEYLQFLNIAYASAAELETYLLLAKELGYVRDNTKGAIDLLDEVRRMLFAIPSSLRSPRSSPLSPAP